MCIFVGVYLREDGGGGLGGVFGARRMVSFKMVF